METIRAWSNREKMKVCRDSVHGYIHLPSEWFKLFIDTPLFQRLRHIEQTSMRCLYPSARHDRFVHSLGTYHLGRKAFQSLTRNAKSVLEQMGIDQKECESARNTFLAACLLHDCAHAPFSHTFEEYYDRGDRLRPLLEERFSDDKSFSDDFIECNASPHEKASAVALIDHYSRTTSELDWNTQLAARMVLGCRYHGCGGEERKQFHNVLISLLNGDPSTWTSSTTSSAIRGLQALKTAVSISIDSWMRPPLPNMEASTNRRSTRKR